MNSFRQAIYFKTLSQSAKSTLFNPEPFLIPPPRMFEKMDVDTLDDKCVESKARIDEIRTELGQANEAVQKQKKAHWFIKALLTNVGKVNIFQSDIIVKRMGKRRAINIHRKKVINECLRAIALYHDVATGLCEKSSISAISDQIGVSTFGKKRYGKYCEMDLDINDLSGKKKSISRVSRAMKFLREMGLIEIHYFTDEVTGKNLPSIIQVTPRFYEVFLVDLELREKAICDKARQQVMHNARKANKHNQIPVIPTDPDNLKEFISKRVETLRVERQRFATLQRKRKYLKNMTKGEIHCLAQNDVKAQYSKESFESMADNTFVYLVRQRERELHLLRQNFEVDDDNFKPNYFHTGSLN